MKKSCTFVCFSGGCFGGKSTTIAAVQKILVDNGFTNVVTLDEIMRRQKIKSIDDLRSDSKNYLAMQEKITRERIEHENAIFENPEDLIVLADRAISDSLFYMTFYMDVTKFTEKEFVRYNNLLVDTINHCKFAYNHIYDRVYFFAPVIGEQTDRFRPDNITHLKHTESMIIKTINNSFAKPRQMIDFDLNTQYKSHVYIDIANEIVNMFHNSKLK